MNRAVYHSSRRATDPLRAVLNGVLFSPEDGGLLVATDGRHLACVPARVPDGQFVLPNAAVEILGQEPGRPAK